MQLNKEIRDSIWFLATHVTVLGASDSDQTRTYEIYQYIKPLESQFLLHHQDSMLILVVYTVSAFAGYPALNILKSKGEYQTAFSRLCRDMENSPDILEML